MNDAQHDPPPTGALIRPFLDRIRAPDDEPAAAVPPAEDPQATVRPFLLTAGRTAAADDLPVETQVVVTPQGRAVLGSLTFESRDIVSLATEPVAVAEIAARLGLHLGVIRVLVGDLQGQGLVTTIRPREESPGDVGTILRVIQGLRQLT